MDFLASALRPGMVFVDGGANVGPYSVLAADRVRNSGKVLAFEPSSASATALRYNARAYAHVHVSQAALGDRCGSAFLYHVNRATSEYSLAPGIAGSGEVVKVVTLDAACDELGISCVDALKLDIEGAEELALRGAEQLITRQPPIVIFEISDRARAFGLDPYGAADWLENRGYTLLELSVRDRSRPPVDRIATRNVIALPPG